MGREVKEARKFGWKEEMNGGREEERSQGVGKEESNEAFSVLKKQTNIIITALRDKAGYRSSLLKLFQ